MQRDRTAHRVTQGTQGEWRCGAGRRGLLLGVLALLSCSESPTAVSLEGSWGGEGVALEITDEGVSLEFDCATGAVEVPLGLDGSGSFTWPGTFTPGQGGPVQEDHQPEPEPAVYSGAVRGDRMSLGGSFGAADTPIGPYQLRKGERAVLRKCL